MIQLTISVFAWMGIVVFQFMVHYVCSGRRSVRNVDDEDDTLKEVAFLQYDFSPPQYPLVVRTDIEQSHEDHTVSTTTTIITTEMTRRERSSSNSLIPDYSSDVPESRMYDSNKNISCDEDDEQQFFRLLDQTGSEMVKVCVSFLK